MLRTGDQTELLKEHELAARWKIDRRTLRNWRSQGKGPIYLKISSLVRYPLEGIRSYERNALQGNPEKGHR